MLAALSQETANISAKLSRCFFPISTHRSRKSRFFFSDENHFPTYCDTGTSGGDGLSHVSSVIDGEEDIRDGSEDNVNTPLTMSPAASPRHNHRYPSSVSLEMTPTVQTSLNQDEEGDYLNEDKVSVNEEKVPMTDIRRAWFQQNGGSGPEENGVKKANGYVNGHIAPVQNC